MSFSILSYFSNELCLQPQTITVSCHPHPLRLECETPYYCCGGCKEKGLGKSYQCCQSHDHDHNYDCDYHLHPQCYNLSESGCSSSIKFTFLESKKCEFVFHKEAAAAGGGACCCDACGREVKGWFYECKICKKPHYLHPCCAHLPIAQKEEGVVLYLKEAAATGKKSKSLTCQECEKENIHVNNGQLGKRGGWFYVSNCRRHCYHVGCVMGMADLHNLKNGSRTGDDDDGCLLKEDEEEATTTDTDGDGSGRKGTWGCNCQSLTVRAETGSRAIRKRQRPKLPMKKILMGAAKIALNLILSAIFGIPITEACVAFYHLFN